MSRIYQLSVALKLEFRLLVSPREFARSLSENLFLTLGFLNCTGCPQDIASVVLVGHAGEDEE